MANLTLTQVSALIASGRLLSLWGARCLWLDAPAIAAGMGVLAIGNSLFQRSKKPPNVESGGFSVD